MRKQTEVVHRGKIPPEAAAAELIPIGDQAARAFAVIEIDAADLGAEDAFANRQKEMKMATQAKINANRSNAARSTGPNTALGKRHSRLNALRGGVYATDGLLRGEDAEAYEAHATDLFNYFEPVGPVHELLTRVVIDDWWKLGRVRGAEDVALRNVENLLYLNDREGTFLSEFNGDVIAQKLRLMIAQDEAERSVDAMDIGNDASPTLLKKSVPLGCTLLEAYAPKPENRLAELDRRQRTLLKDILRNSEILMDAKERRHTIAPVPAIHEIRRSRKSSRIPLALNAPPHALALSAEITIEDAVPDVESPAHSPQNDGGGD